MAAGSPHMDAYSIPSWHVVPVPSYCVHPACPHPTQLSCCGACTLSTVCTQPAFTLHSSAAIPLAKSAFLSVSLSPTPPDTWSPA